MPSQNTESLQQVKLLSNQRVFFCGKTGSGKTYLAEHLTRRLHRLVVLDGKGTLDKWRLDPWNRESKRLLREGEAVRARVLWDINTEPVEFWSEVMSECYNARNVTVYIDEVYRVVEPQTKVPNIFNALYTQGRELGIGVWASTQRPTWIPLVCMSESEHYFMFHLNMEKDKATMAAFMGEQVEKKISDPHGFYYSFQEWTSPVYVRRFVSKDEIFAASNRVVKPADAKASAKK